MKKVIIVPSIIFVLVSLLLSNCKSNQSTETEKMKQDSIQKTASTTTLSTKNNKFLIAPPDTNYTGDYIDKYPNGVIKFSGFFRFGQRHGQWMAFYENGLKWSECFYDKGKRHGSSMVFFPNGKLHYSGWFKNDQRDSLWVFYDEKGNEVDRRAFKNDVETGLVR